MPDERKLVTILFADVTGSTALGESLELEDLRAYLGRYYDHARRIIEEHGGALEKFIGDAVMAVFGLPHAHSNDAERALATALALRQAVEADEALGGRLVLRMGVNTGSVISTITGDVHHGDFLVTGDAVNVAARLEQYASPGEILVSERTVNAAEAAFIFGPQRTLIVRGKTQPITVAPLHDQRPARALGRPPLVGRKSDLAQLALLRERALAERRPQLVSIVAPAGTGKTRLLEEFLELLDPEEGFQVATASCLPYGQTLAYWPLRGLLEALLGAEQTRDAAVRALERGGHTADDAHRLAGLALATVGMETPDDAGAAVVAEREVIFSAWRLLIEALAREAPRIIVFEDLHWASESLLDLVEHVMQPRTQAPLLIVATSRPELLDRRPAWGGGRRNFTALTLEPLSAADTRVLVSKLVEGAPETVRVRIAERSGGNPFFAIELARGMRDDNDTGDNLPDTVHEAVQERLDALAPRERAVLQAAAVAGRAFRPATLKAALDAQPPVDEVESALDGLLARDLITSEDGGAYTFRHILIRDVAYGALARGERIRMHMAVGAWLEDFAAGRLDEFVELIAYHYSQAAQLVRQSIVPLEGALDTARAVIFLERAGEVAARAGALVEARGYIERAIDLAEGAERARLYESLGDCVIISDVAVSAYQRALEGWRAELEPDPLVGARLRRKLLVVLIRWLGTITVRMPLEEMATLRAEARELARAAGDEYEIGRLAILDLFWPWWSGEITLEEARTQLARGLEAVGYFEERGDWRAFSEALDGYASRAQDIGDYAAAADAARRRLGAPALPLIERADALGELVWNQCDAGDYGGAIATVRDAIARRRPGDPSLTLGQAPAWGSLAACYAGEWAALDECVALLDEAWGELRRDMSIRLLGWGYLAPLYVAMAREDKAAIAHTADMVGRFGSARHGDVLRAMIEASLRDDPAPLQDLLRSAGDRAEIFRGFWYLLMFLNERGQSLPRPLLGLLSVSARARAIDVLRCCTQIALALGEEDDVALAAAIDVAEAHGLIPHAARMRIVLAQRTGDRAQLKRARPVLERLGDKQFLRKLEAASRLLRRR